MSYIKIQNEGVIDKNAFTLLGASSKRDDDSKIGFFGSGLKYALAVLLRNGHEVKVFAGEKEIKVTTKKKGFRGQDFNVICVDGKETGFTVEAGPSWLPWFAIRELYCNAIDEGGQKIGLGPNPVGEDGKTNIFVSWSEDMKEVFDNWNDYFSEKRKDMLFEFEDGSKIFSNGSTASKRRALVYRKGIQCYEGSEWSLFDYDFDDIKINESRVVESDYELKTKVPILLAKCTNRSIIRQVFKVNNTYWEYGLYWEYASLSFSKEWLDVIGGKAIVPDLVSGYFESEIKNNQAIIVPHAIVKALKRYFGSEVRVLGDQSDDSSSIVREHEITSRQGELLDSSLAFINSNIENADIKKEDVRVCTFISESQLGEYTNGSIYLSERLFTRGKKEIVMTLLEEWIHKTTKAEDYTRSFQDELLHQWVNALEVNSGEML